MLRLRFSGSALCALVLLGITTPAHAQQSVPFQARFGGTIVFFGPVLSDGTQVLVATGGGELSHLGKTTFVQNYIFNNFTGAFTGTSIFTGANGDGLNISFAGQESTTGQIVGSFTITGGTGRFLNGSGGGGLAGLDFGNGTFSIRTDGTISYQASDGKK